MSLDPIRYPQKDFFILDMADVVPKDDMETMEHPFYSLSTRRDRRSLKYEMKDVTLEVKPSYSGLPTIFDKDILIFCISQLMHRKNRGLAIDRKVCFSAREFMMSTNRPTGGNQYKRLEEALDRLAGTRFEYRKTKEEGYEYYNFGMIEAAGFSISQKGRKDKCYLVLSDWIMSAIEKNTIATISNDYFRIRRPLERRIYEISRKHCGNQKRWNISLEKLQNKCGSNAPLKKFRHNIREIIEDGQTPDYKISLNSQDDIVTIRPRANKHVIDEQIILDEWAEEKARKIAREKGWDYYVLKDKWIEFASSEKARGNPAKDYNAAFIAYCRKQPNLR